MSHSIQYHQMSAVLREIRLLQIDTNPPPDDEDDALRCSLRHVVLDSQPERPYAAMSYCWGPVPEESYMTIDGRKARVRQSAATALRSVIREAGELIWIDAICINQEDIPEKGRQVAIMKDIYMHANEVRIWLGNLEDDVAYRAIEAARRIHAQCIQETNHLKDLSLHLYGKGGGGFKYSDAALPELEGCGWESLRELYSLPWFTRLWVVQEVALARKATCYVGKYTVDADVVTVAARWMVHRKYHKHFGGEVEGIENASSMYRPTARPLSNQLRRMHRQGCMDDRDRVYGLLGILSPRVAAAIVPDYTLPLVDVYTRTHRVSFEEGGNLELLRLVAWYVSERSTQEEPLNRFKETVGWLWSLFWGRAAAKARPWPSWVAKVHAPTEHANGSCLNVQTFDQPAWPLQIRDLRDPFVLSVKGLDISAILSVSEPFTKETIQDGKRLAAAIRRCLDQVNHVDHGLDEKELRHELMLSFNCGINSKNSDGETDKELPSQYESFAAWCKAFGNPLSSSASVDGQPVPEYSQSMWRAINRRLFITAGGRLGMGPYGTQTGDHVVMLSGTQGVFVLRPQGGLWRLIGDAYCRRFMKVCAIPKAVLPLLTANRELIWTHGFTPQNMMQGVSGSISAEPDRQNVVKCNEHPIQG